MATSQPKTTGFMSLDGTAPNSGESISFDGMFKAKDQKFDKFSFELRPDEDTESLVAEYAPNDGVSTPFTMQDKYWGTPMVRGKLSVSVDPKKLKVNSIYHIEALIKPFQFTDKKTGKELDGFSLVFTSVVLAANQAIPAVAQNVIKTHKSTTPEVTPKKGKAAPKAKASSKKKKAAKPVVQAEEEDDDDEEEEPMDD